MYRDYVAQDPNTSEGKLKAAEHIDILTYNRIVDYDSLTEFQKRTVDRVHEQLTSFETENADLIAMYLKRYTINGVSMEFGATWNLKVIGGIAIPSELYALLRLTGLCYPAI